MKSRIWELDAFRGLCVLGMVAVHFIFDLVYFYGLVDWQLPPAFLFLQQWGGVLFLLLSGICITLGSRSVRRGLIVLAAGLLVSAVTIVMHRVFFFHESVIIRFGVLHCLGICMLLWPIFRKLPWWGLVGVGISMVLVGLYISGIRVTPAWLYPLGLKAEGFQSADYFPLLPNLGFFLLGAAIGKTAYQKKVSLLPDLSSSLPIRFLTFCGRQSLPIYLLHQPILSGIFYLLSIL